MSEELTKLEPVKESLVHLVARNPQEMQVAQSGLKQWLVRKIAQVGTDITDYQASLDQATKNKWNRTGLRKAVNTAVAQRDFYEKILAAVEAGYTIVPEFLVDVFAIRVGREDAVPEHSTSRYKGGATLAPESPDFLPDGLGEYVSDTPKARSWKETKTDEKGNSYTLYHREAVGLQGVEFPVRAARVEVMSATVEAMALRVFDQIGICPATKKADPLIIGQILLKTGTYSQKVVSFLIAWHLNLNEL